jgi:hypothetical protein
VVLAVGGGEGDAEAIPVDLGVVGAEPGETEDHRVGGGGDVELEGLNVWTDDDLEREGFVGDGAGGGMATIGHEQRQGSRKWDRGDVVSEGKGGVHEAEVAPRVDEAVL